jgi:hypothetical protein|tara:strand:+ start:244 stop:492 length:249 start_codon:yes stop_codon:yes gene_type:complete
MENIKDTVIQHCLELLKRDDVKNELKGLMKPMIDLILEELYPYIFLSIVFVFISFLLILGIFILLMRNKMLIKSPLGFLKLS